MKKSLSLLIISALVLGLFIAGAGLFPAALTSQELPTPQEMWRDIKKTLPPLFFNMEKDETVTSLTDPARKLRRLEVSFLSQVYEGVEMVHKAVIYLPADPPINKRPGFHGRVVIVATRSFDDSMELNYAEPIAARTGYPTMCLDLPTDYPGEEGESPWLRRFRARAAETGDPGYHDFIRLAIPYLQGLDILADILKETNIRAVIGGHSKRAYYAYTAAAMDPARIASVIFMGCERLYYREEFPKAINPFHTQSYVRCPVFYIGATNEGGYEMFNINEIQERMTDTWAIEYIPNYRHASNSERQFLNWPMWVAHIFNSRPITTISDMSFKETETGTRFRARIDSPNTLILVKAWFVYCDDVPFWRDLVWYPADMKTKGENIYECHVNGTSPDAWFIEVKDTAMGFQGYISSLPMDITGKPTKERTHTGPAGRHWTPKKK